MLLIQQDFFLSVRCPSIKNLVQSLIHSQVLLKVFISSLEIDSDMKYIVQMNKRSLFESKIAKLCARKKFYPGKKETSILLPKTSLLYSSL